MSRKIKRIALAVVAIITVLCISDSWFSKKDCCEIGTVYVPDGIMVDGKIYWDVEGLQNNLKGEKVGTLKDSVESGCLPIENFTGTRGMKAYLGADIYQNEDGYFLRASTYDIQFRFLNTMKNEERFMERIKDPKIPDQSHFMYQNMLYIDHTEILDKLPKNFKEVGEITKNCQLADENFSGNLAKGTKLYGMDEQNYMMLVETKQGYAVYINSAYMEEVELQSNEK